MLVSWRLGVWGKVIQSKTFTKWLHSRASSQKGEVPGSKDWDCLSRTVSQVRLLQKSRMRWTSSIQQTQKIARSVLWAVKSSIRRRLRPPYQPVKLCTRNTTQSFLSAAVVTLGKLDNRQKISVPMSSLQFRKQLELKATTCTMTVNRRAAPFTR